MPPSLSYKINSSFPDPEKSESLSLCSIIVMSSFPITLEPQCMRGPSQSCSEIASTILKGIRRMLVKLYKWHLVLFHLSLACCLESLKYYLFSLQFNKWLWEKPVIFSLAIVELDKVNLLDDNSPEIIVWMQKLRYLCIQINIYE